MKRAVGFLAALVLTVGLVRPCWGVELTLTSHAALLMEKSTGEILYAQNEHDALPPASVTKIMTVLLTMEAIHSGRIALDDMVTVRAYAAGMGGSQVFLAEGEQMSVDDLLKAVRHLEQMTEQAGKPKENSFSLHRIRLPRLHLPHVSIPALISLLMAAAALLLLWWGLGTVWSSSSLLPL